jgi:hypothetical protein
MPASYLACEGPHDAALLGRLVETGGFMLQKKRSLIAPGPFARLVSAGVPDALFGRDPLPNVWRKDDHWIAVHPVGGDGELPKALARITAQASSPLDAVGAFIDADLVTPATRLSELQATLLAINPEPGFAFTGGPGIVVTGTNAQRTGVYVMPDNVNSGSVEGVLDACAQVSYADLHEHAGTYLATFKRSLLTEPEQTRFVKGSNARKAHLGVIGSVLRPGSAIQNTIRDDRWIDATTSNLPLVAQLRAFLRDLLNEPAI